MSVLDELKCYINSNESSGALLLTGQWGCGKTYLINTLSEQLDKKEYSVVIVSLFGIESITSLTNSIKQKYLFAKSEILEKVEEKTEKHKGLISTIADVLKNHVPVANTVMSINPFDLVQIENIDKKGRKLVLVFDDFERSSDQLDMVTLLGAINEYVESKKIKTILVADEAKIIDDKYKDFKEKVVSRTIKLTPDYPSIIHEIINHYSQTEEGYRSFLLEQESLIIQLFYESKSENIRTIRSVIVDFERIFSCLKETQFDSTLAGFILYSFGAMLFEYKSGNYSANKYGYLFADTKLNEKYPYFNKNQSKFISLQTWIINGIWSEEDFKAEYHKHYCVTQPSDAQKLLHWSFWDLCESIVQNGFPILLEQAYQGELTCGSLMKFIQKICLLRTNNISIPIPVEYEKINAGLDLRANSIRDNLITEPELHTFILPEEIEPMNPDERALYQKAFDIGDHMVSYWNNRRDFIEGVKTDDEKTLYELQNRYYISFDDKMRTALYSHYIIANNDIKRALARLMSQIILSDIKHPQKEILIISLKNLELLKKQIDSLFENESDGFTRMIHASFLKVLSDRIDYVNSCISTLK